VWAVACGVWRVACGVWGVGCGVGSGEPGAGASEGRGGMAGAPPGEEAAHAMGTADATARIGLGLEAELLLRNRASSGVAGWERNC
jgi:hypothetical protein